MNARQEAKLNMYRAVEAQIDSNPTVVSAVPAFQNAFNKLKAKIVEIIGTTQQKDVPLSGIAVTKNNSKKTLCQNASEIAGVIYAYASETGDEKLKAEANYSMSKLLKTRDDQLAPRCQNIHDKGAALLADLTDYPITAAALTDLQTAIDNYSTSTAKPRTATSHRKMLRDNLVILFRETDAILVQPRTTSRRPSKKPTPISSPNTNPTASSLIHRRNRET
jgi:hypothetical protein